MSALGRAELEDEIATLAAHLSAGMCDLLLLVGEFDRRGCYVEYGCGSTAEWLAWRCALSPRSAREHVRVARRLPELDRIRQAFARGELSFSKVRALTRVATAANEEELLDLAETCTASQLERVLRAYRQVTAEEAREQQEDAYLSVFWNPDGSLDVHGRLAAEDGALLLRALDAQRDRFWARGSAEPRPTRQVSNREALVAVADTALAAGDAARTGGERYQVVVHADETALAGDGDGDGGGGCVLEDGSAIATETARRLACDASVVRNGRRSRTIPPATRRALRARDRGCRFPGCENRRFVDAHHVDHWGHGGETKLDNLILLCRRHHRAVHEGGYRVDADGRFYAPWGGLVPPAPSLPRDDPNALLERHRELEIDALTGRNGSGERIDDFAYVVDVLVQRLS